MEQCRRLSMTFFMWRVHFRLHFSCYGMCSVMLQINEYDDDDDDVIEQSSLITRNWIIVRDFLIVLNLWCDKVYYNKYFCLIDLVSMQHHSLHYVGGDPRPINVTHNRTHREPSVSGYRLPGLAYWTRLTLVTRHIVTLAWIAAVRIPYCCYYYYYYY